ncbi:MAG TPA: glycine zipper 2TM domain-containing protein, partial [Phenylobacterium sp.]|nr:glycine zipper 2TM domain-containing protein [Phenylobacterium sp.]
RLRPVDLGDRTKPKREALQWETEGIRLPEESFMRLQNLVAGVCAAALIPTVALAQQTCQERQANRVAGTVVGAGVGALAGSAIAGRGDRTGGAVIGGIAGAIVGNQISKGSGSRADCSRAYGYYDNNGTWHANAVARNDAAGYFDRNGNWVEGAPLGYYDRGGQWVEAAQDPSAAGYYDSRGYWVPASAGGYYDADGRWVAAAAPGYYDRAGRWIARPSVGHYDEYGRWIEGQPAGRMVNGVWVSDPQPGYYENGRWVRGPAVGYYDARGRWISTSTPVGRPAYDAGTVAERRNLDDRIDRLDQRIRRGMEDGSLDRREARQALQSLESIRRDEAALTERLDQLSEQVRIDRRD